MFSFYFFTGPTVSSVYVSKYRTLTKIAKRCRAGGALPLQKVKVPHIDFRQVTRYQKDVAGRYYALDSASDA